MTGRNRVRQFGAPRPPLTGRAARSSPATMPTTFTRSSPARRRRPDPHGSPPGVAVRGPRDRRRCRPRARARQPRRCGALRAGSRRRREPRVALQLYTDLATDETALVVDQMEARGGIGRCYKEMFLSCTEPARRQRYLTAVPRGVPHRLPGELGLTRGMASTPWPCWRGLGRDGIALPAEMPSATALADEILRSVDSSPVHDTWTEVTACEAAIALGRYDEAVERAEAFIETTPHGFTVAAFHRQLQKVWQLTTSSSRATSCSRSFARRCSGTAGAKSQWSPRTSAPHALPSSTTHSSRESSDPTASCR